MFELFDGRFPKFTLTREKNALYWDYLQTPNNSSNEFMYIFPYFPETMDWNFPKMQICDGKWGILHDYFVKARIRNSRFRNSGVKQ